jgi:hypothetical protein
MPAFFGEHARRERALIGHVGQKKGDKKRPKSDQKAA